jgi:molybdenum cofactor biosynthesis enzyme MoaA
MSEEEVAIDRGVTYLRASDSFRIAPGVSLLRPISVCIHLNLRCNLKCIYCLSNSGPWQPKGVGVLQRSLSIVARWAPLRLVWSGGEPLLERGLQAHLLSAKRASCFNVLTTNGSIRAPEYLAELADWVDVSVHGVSPRTFEFTTGSDRFDLVMANISALVRFHPRVAASVVLVRRFLPDLYSTVRRLADIGVRKIRVSRLLELGRGACETEEDLEDRRLVEAAAGALLVVPAVRKRAQLMTGYLVLERDGTLSSPPDLSGEALSTIAAHKAWTETLAAHRILFDGVKD